MDITFDSTQPSVLQGLGMDEKDFADKSAEILKIGRKVNDVMESIVSSDYSDNIKLAMVFELGANFGQNVMVNKLKEEAAKTQDEVLMQLQGQQVAH